MPHFVGSVLLGLSLLVSCPVACLADDMATLVRDYDAYNRQLDPVRAAQRGDVAAARVWPDNSPGSCQRRKVQLEQFEQRLRHCRGRAPRAEDALNHDLVADRVAMALEATAFDEERMPFISGDGFYTTPDYAALNTVLRNEADAAAWIARLEAIPAYFARETENMRRGISTGFTQPRPRSNARSPMSRASSRCQQRRAPIAGSFCLTAATDGAEQREALAARGRAVFDEQVRPAQRALLDFFETEYLPRARKEIGIASVPQGRDVLRVPRATAHDDADDAASRSMHSA